LIFKNMIFKKLIFNNPAARRQGRCVCSFNAMNEPKTGTIDAATRTEPERFTLTLAAVPDQNAVPAVIRLRRFLKAALRCYGLRCTDCRAVSETQADHGEGDATVGTAAKHD
jgi:hypothetical protein